MNLSDLLSGLRRRWYAAIAGLLVTAVLGLAAFSLVAAQYVTTASITLLPPSEIAGVEGNPYLSLNGLQAAGDVLARAMTGDANSQLVTQGSAKTTYTFEADAGASGPMYVLEVHDQTAGASLATMARLLAKTPQVLTDLQVNVGAKPATLIRMAVITTSATAVPDHKSQIRAVIVALVVGLAITLFGTNLLDAFLVRRQQRLSGDAPVGRGRSRRRRSDPATETGLLARPVAPPVAPGVPTELPTNGYANGSANGSANGTIGTVPPGRRMRPKKIQPEPIPLPPVETPVDWKPDPVRPRRSRTMRPRNDVR